MSSASTKLSDRHQLLLSKIQAERFLLAQHGQQIRQSLAIVDLGVGLVKKIRPHPALAAGVLAALVVLKPRRLFPILKSGLFVWKIWQKFKPLFKPSGYSTATKIQN